jgi:hypothetical protein
MSDAKTTVIKRMLVSQNKYSTICKHEEQCCVDKEVICYFLLDDNNKVLSRQKCGDVHRVTLNGETYLSVNDILVVNGKTHNIRILFEDSDVGEWNSYRENVLVPGNLRHFYVTNYLV